MPHTSWCPDTGRCPEQQQADDSVAQNRRPGALARQVRLVRAAELTGSGARAGPPAALASIYLVGPDVVQWDGGVARSIEQLKTLFLQRTPQDDYTGARRGPEALLLCQLRQGTAEAE